jgi:hypothetical protein
MVATYDLVNTIPARMAPVGLSNIDLAARYAKLSPTTLRRVLSGRPGTSEVLRNFDETLRELADLKEQCWPCPLDFREVGEIRNLQRRLKNESTTISEHGRIVWRKTDTARNISLKERNKMKGQGERLKCGDVLTTRSETYYCELPIDHRGKHRGGGWADVPGGVYWTRQGAERIAKEIAAETNRG